MAFKLFDHIDEFSARKARIEFASDDRKACRNAEKSPSGGIDGADAPICIEGGHPGPDGPQDDLHIAPPAFQLGSGLLGTRPRLP